MVYLRKSGIIFYKPESWALFEKSSIIFYKLKSWGLFEKIWHYFLYSKVRSHNNVLMILGSIWENLALFFINHKLGVCLKNLALFFINQNLGVYWENQALFFIQAVSVVLTAISLKTELRFKSYGRLKFWCKKSTLVNSLNVKSLTSNSYLN